MANYKDKISGFYEVILNNSEINKCSSNYIFFTVDTEYKSINYIINEKNLINYLTKTVYLFDKDIVNIKEVIELLKDDIYKIYKTRVAEKRIPQILLNILVFIGVLYSDDGVDFKIHIKNIKLQDILSKIKLNIS